MVQGKCKMKLLTSVGKCSPLCCPILWFQSHLRACVLSWVQHGHDHVLVWLGRKGHVPTCDKRCYGISGDNSTTATISTIVLGVNGRTCEPVYLSEQCSLSMVDNHWLYSSWIDPVASIVQLWFCYICIFVQNVVLEYFSYWECVLCVILLVCMKACARTCDKKCQAGKKGPIVRKQMGASDQDASTNDLSLTIICCHPLHVLPHHPLCSLFITTAVELGLYQLTVASSQTPPTHHDSDPRPLIIQTPSYNVAGRVTLSHNLSCLLVSQSCLTFLFVCISLTFPRSQIAALDFPSFTLFISLVSHFQKQIHLITSSQASKLR